MKKLYKLFIFLLATNTVFAQGRISHQTDKDSPQDRQNFEFNKIKDPTTGKVPFDELEKARSLMTTVLTTMGQIPGVEWQERGPNNIGGRTRALMFDPNDATYKKVWAGGVAGGLWYNNDITSGTSSWQKVYDFWDNLAISCIAYSPNNPQIFYVGTGEGFGNSDGVQGGGIWKTTDGGLTWKRLAATIPTYTGYTGAAFAFQSVQKIVVSASGIVFAATKAGVWYSSDEGVTWTVAASIPSGGSYASFVSDLEIGTDNVVYSAYGSFYGTNSGIYKTINAANDGTAWSANLFTFAGTRTEIALAPSTSGATQVIYAFNEGAGSYYLGSTKRSSDGGTTWVDIAKPTGGGTTTDITNGQAWYDLILSVSPTDPNILYAAGATNSRSLNANTPTGTSVTWNTSNYGANMHPDNHAAVFRPTFPNEILFGNDGGIFYSSNWGNSSVTSPSYSSRNNGYNVTQYYSASIKNITNDGYVIAAAQDNGAQKITTVPGVIGAGTYIQNCCDGMVTFIDQNESKIQIHAPQYNSFWLYNESTGANTDIMPSVAQGWGSFVNPADYDSQNNILYTNDGYDNMNSYISRTPIVTGNPPTPGTFVDVAFLPLMDITFIKAGLTLNTVFVGNSSGQIYKLTNVDGVVTPTATLIGTLNSGTISCIDIGATENELIVTLSNYNVKSIYYTNDGGTTWVSKDEATYGLPNIPVRAVLFNPVNRLQVLLATELGVWSTNDITAANPQWTPTNAKLAHVRCEQLRFRSTDNTVVVATHGRGIFTTKLNQAVPCQTVMMLVAPYDNKTSGTANYANTETISATNQITGTANVTYAAARSIVLLPTNPTDGGAGFKVDKGTVFQAYIQGCASTSPLLRTTK